MKIIEIDGPLDPDLEELLAISGRVMTERQMMRKIVLRAIDPIIPSGLPFEFETRPDDPMYLSIEVPSIGVDVDLAQAWTVAQLDAKAAAFALDRDDSLAATLRVYTNQFQWLAFWSARHPNVLCRKQFQDQLAERQAGLNELKLKAQLKFRLDVVNELNAI